MPNPLPTADRCQISFPARGAVLRAIMARVEEGATIADATNTLLEQALGENAAEAPSALAPADFIRMVDLDVLVAEVRRRVLAAADVTAELERAIAERDRLDARAGDAERRLASISAALADLPVRDAA